MKYIPRRLRHVISGLSRMFPAVVLTGPRRAGKTMLLRRLFPRAAYVLLEDPDIQSRARSDPRGFLDQFAPPVIFDEIQNVPALFDYVRTRIDMNPRRKGLYLFTGSQEAPLMRGVTESMAGRAAILQLFPFSSAETDRVTLLNGAFPEVLANPKGRAIWFNSYIQTYLEREVRAVTNIRDPAAFRRFFALLASRQGQILNKTDLAAPLGVSVPTIADWLHILEITGQIILVPPYFENFGKRLVKSPKIYIGDTGLTCHLLGIATQAELERSPFLGAIFEGYVASEIVKSQANYGIRKELYHFRDQQELEVDFLFPSAQGTLWMTECNASKTVDPSMTRPLDALARAIPRRLSIRRTVIHRKSPSAPTLTALAPGIEALDVDAFIADLNSSPAFGSRPHRRKAS